MHQLRACRPNVTRFVRAARPHRQVISPLGPDPRPMPRRGDQRYLDGRPSWNPRLTILRELEGDAFFGVSRLEQQFAVCRPGIGNKDAKTSAVAGDKSAR